MFENKNIVIDTSVLVSVPHSVHSFPKSNLIISFEVLEELDKHKTRKDEVGKSARYVNRFLDSLMKEGSLTDGVTLDNEQTIFVLGGKAKLHAAFEDDTYDNRILSVAKRLSEKLGDVVVLSNDITFRLKARAFNIEAQELSSKLEMKRESGLYSGTKEVEVTDAQVDMFYEMGQITLLSEKFHPNQFVLLKADSKTALARASGLNSLVKLKTLTKKNHSVEGIKPRNSEQTFALEALLDPELSLVSLTGIAGSGKTLLAIASAMQGLHSGSYKKVIITRPMESTSKEIGFLPGDKLEKMAPWVQPIFDNLEALYGNKGKVYIDSMMHKGSLEVEALTFIRGRTLPDTIFIVDEAQNITYDEAKAILTRMGENSKLILIGDLEQIDSPKLNEYNSGLANVVELFKSFDGAAHVSLKKGERSKLATFAAKNM